MLELARIPNRSALLTSLRRFLQERQPTSLLYFDVDNFKEINDTLGHSKGDERLLQIVGAILPVIDRKGKLYRWGGDEFCIVLPNSSEDESAGTAERVRKVVDGLPLMEKIKNTLSIGMACSEQAGTDPDAMVTSADAAMYESKRFGGNQISTVVGGKPQLVDRRQRTQKTNLSDLLRRESEIKIIYSELTLGRPVRNAIDRSFSSEAERISFKEHFLVPTDPDYDPKLYFRGTKVACVCEVRSAGYLSYSLAEAGMKAQILAATAPLVGAQLHRQSFIALGAKSNQMTDQLVNDPGNTLVDIDVSDISDTRFRSKSGKFLTPRRSSAGEDYGLIIRIHPERYPEKTWIACAGLGEFGTSGSAHFLAFSWWMIVEEIAKRGARADKANFACIVRTDGSASDDNARIFNFATADHEWQEYPGS